MFAYKPRFYGILSKLRIGWDFKFRSTISKEIDRMEPKKEKFENFTNK
jgi:hypothetical protein